MTQYLLRPTTPGIFIPNSGTYVFIRQFLKRSLIIMAEDSEYDNDLAFNFHAALLASRMLNGFNPDFWIPKLIKLAKPYN